MLEHATREWRPLLLAACGLSAACFRGGFAPGQTPGDLGSLLDASAEDGVSQGDGAATPTCTPWSGNWTFSTPELVTELNSSSMESEPQLSPDELRIFFCSDRPGGAGGQDVYVATRTSRRAPFGGPHPLASINTAANETRFAETQDGLTAYLASTRPGGKGGSDLWVASRPDLSTPWTSAAFQPLAALNTADDEFDPFPSADGLTLYFERQGGSGESAYARVFVARRAAPMDPFGAPQPMTELDPSNIEGNPSISEDGLAFVFNTSRTGGPGGADIWYMRRSSSSEAFSTPQPLPGVNSTSYEAESFLTPDGCALYFASTRPGGQGERDLYRSQFVRLP